MHCILFHSIAALKNVMSKPSGRILRLVTCSIYLVMRWSLQTWCYCAPRRTTALVTWTPPTWMGRPTLNRDRSPRALTRWVQDGRNPHPFGRMSTLMICHWCYVYIDSMHRYLLYNKYLCIESMYRYLLRHCRDICCDITSPHFVDSNALNSIKCEETSVQSITCIIAHINNAQN